MKRIKYGLLFFIICVGLSSVSQSHVYALTYFGYDKGGSGTWHDAEKSPINTEDDLMCWAAAASNTLAWTGWGNVQTGANHDSIFQVYQNHWTDEGGNSMYAWEWWFNGVNRRQGTAGWSQVDVPGGGNYYPALNFEDYFQWQSNDLLALPAIDNYLHNGYGVNLSIFEEGRELGHELTVWGYDYDDSGYQGIWVTDSDDWKTSVNPPDMLYYYDVANIGGEWFLTNYGDGDWFITEVRGLAQAPRGTVPEPSTLIFLAAGLAGVIGCRMKLRIC